MSTIVFQGSVWYRARVSLSLFLSLFLWNVSLKRAPANSTIIPYKRSGIWRLKNDDWCWFCFVFLFFFVSFESRRWSRNFELFRSCSFHRQISLKYRSWRLIVLWFINSFFKSSFENWSCVIQVILNWYCFLCAENFRKIICRHK